MESAAAGGGKKPHAVCLPYPVQGDITAMLQLAKLLHARGFHITFVNTEYNHRRLLRSRRPEALDGIPGFTFASIPDGLPPSDNIDGTQDTVALCGSTSSTCLPHLLALLAQLNDPDSSSVPPVTCLVVDGFMSFAYEAARQIGVPCAALWTFSASAFVGCRHYRLLIDRGLVPLQDEAQLTNGSLDTMVDGVPGTCEGIQLRDFPAYIRTTDSNNIKLNFFMHEAERFSLPDGVIFNTFDDLERPALDAMSSILPPMYAVGPLCLHVRHAIPVGSPLQGIGSNLLKEQDDVLEWLDGQAPRSIVYVNFGSIAMMTSEQLMQFAWGLADSGYCFLWNIRPGLVKGEAAAADLPPELLAAVKGRSKLSTWCPQEKVLQHEAIRLFLTHSGWNSTLESISAGVPMLCQPFFADQPTNCRYVRTEWGNGMEISLDEDVRRAELAAMIQNAIRGNKGREMGRRAQEWKEKAKVATLPGGSSIDNLGRLIDEVLQS